MSVIDTRVNYKGEVFSYSAHNKHFWAQHASDRIQRELVHMVEPFVEVGFDAQQIKEELEYMGYNLLRLSKIEEAVSIALGEQHG